MDEKKILKSLENKLNLLKENEIGNLWDKKNQEHIIKILNLNNDYWKKFIAEIFSKILKDSYVIIKGLPFDDNNFLFIAFACTLGNLVRHNSRVPEIVRILNPRLGYNPFENFPHTDSSHWPNPNDLTLLQGIRADQNGKGISRIVSVGTLIDELKNNGQQDLIKKLSETKIPFLLDPDFGNAGMQMHYVLTNQQYASKENYHIRFCRNDTKVCFEKFSISEADKITNRLLEVENIIINIGRKTQFLVREGELLIFDNKTSLHSKTETSENSVRELKKIKLNIQREVCFSN